ncbi:hypothetical protein IJ843_06955 [bacterium]|nr:hypothetical protein [bacterium]
MPEYTTDNTTLAGYRVFETLKYITMQPANVIDIIKYLEKLPLNENKPLSKGVIYKYITTLKFAGINITAKKCKYEVKNLPFKIDFSKENIEALSILNILLEYTPETDISEKINDFFYKLKMRYALEEEYPGLYKKFKIILKKPNENQIKIINRYEKYCQEKLKVHIDYMDILGNTQSIICEPIDVKFEDNQVWFQLFCKSKNEFLELNSKQIIKVYQTPSKCAEHNKECAQTTIFKITGKLTKRYTLRNNEQIIKSDNDEIIISNKEEAKDKLYLRIMRYAESCEICSPKTERNNMINIINKTLKNYGISEEE